MTDSKEELRLCFKCGGKPKHFIDFDNESMVKCLACGFVMGWWIWKYSFGWKLLDESRERERKLLEAEHKLSDAYLRIRKLVGAWQTPIAPTPEQIYELTENKVRELIRNVVVR